MKPPDWPVAPQQESLWSQTSNVEIALILAGLVLTLALTGYFVFLFTRRQD
jgi:hypothetical protein